MTTPAVGASESFVAVDLGATSGRVIIGRLRPELDGPGSLELEVVHRFANDPVRITDGLHWNILELFRQVVIGLRAALARGPVTSIGIDAWAVDYGLVRGDRLIGSPFHYRDARTAQGVDLVHRAVGPEDLYAAAGLQFLPFTTLYQLAVDRADGILTDDDTVLLIPDLLAFWLTGVQVAERTNASTTGLLALDRRDWDASVITALDLPRSAFPALVDAGHVVGPAVELGGVSVVTVGSHDTASAVVAVPADRRDFAYVSSGTWSLVGVELDAPVTTEAARRANFTNEGGVDGRTRFLTNVSGLWLLSESIRTWQDRGEAVDLEQLLASAATVTEEVGIFDPADERFVPPGDMPDRIRTWCAEHDQPVPLTPAVVVRSILESLAQAYAVALDRAVALSGRDVEVVHVVGGGAQNSLLCQLTADATGRVVLAGPVEATAIGNILVQARTAGVLHGSLEDLRALVRRAFPPARYEPRRQEA